MYIFFTKERKCLIIFQSSSIKDIQIFLYLFGKLYLRYFLFINCLFVTHLKKHPSYINHIYSARTSSRIFFTNLELSIRRIYYHLFTYVLSLAMHFIYKSILNIHTPTHSKHGGLYQHLSDYLLRKIFLQYLLFLS